MSLTFQLTQGDALAPLWDKVPGDTNRARLNTLLELHQKAQGLAAVVGEVRPPKPTEKEEHALLDTLKAESAATGVPVELLMREALSRAWDALDAESQNLDTRVRATVQAIMVQNMAEPVATKRIGITPKAILARTWGEYGKIKRWLWENRHLIEAHHSSAGISDPHWHNQQRDRAAGRPERVA